MKLSELRTILAPFDADDIVVCEVHDFMASEDLYDFDVDVVDMADCREIRISLKDHRQTAEYITHNDEEISIGGTHIQGYIDEGYATLKKVFGNPEDGDGYNVDAQWSVEFQNGTVATIYNYKNGKNYCGREGIAKTKIRDWHIGGFTEDAVTKVKQTLEKYYEKTSVPALRK